MSAGALHKNPVIEIDKSVIELKHLSVVNKTSSSGDYTVVGATAHLWERCFLLEAKARPLWISWTWISCLYTTGDIILSDICVTATLE